MSTYNFTVRATDNLGAYADRTFSMTVNNTNVERFVITGNSGLAHSPTGLSGTWTVETGTFGENTEFVNGLWLNYGYNNTSTVIKTSTDAMYWNTINVTFPIPTDNGYVWRFYRMGKIKFFKNKWYAYVFFVDSANARLQITEFTSSDLMSWTQTANVSGTLYYGPNTYSQEINDVYYDSGTDTTVLILGLLYTSGTVPSAMLFSKVGTGAWTKRFDTNNSIVGGGYKSGSIVFINGLWCVNTGADIATGVHTSIDAVNFTNRPLPSFNNPGTNSAINSNTGSLIYNDGRLLSYIQSSGGGETGTLASSLNGGRTWTRLSGATPVYSTQHVTRQWMASYGTILLMVNGGGTTNANSLTVSQNGGSTTSSFSINPSLGSVYGVVARQT